MPRAASKTAVLTGLIGALGLFLCLFTLRRFFVGFWSDDARDILAAQSILQGHYAFLQLPGHPPANFPLPGFPLLLAPWVALVAPHWGGLKLLSILFSGAGLGLAYTLWGKDLSVTGRLLFATILALNPNTIALSTQVLADAPYLFLLMSALFLLSRADRADPWTLGLYIASSAWAAWTRPEGYGLLLALLWTWSPEKRSPYRWGTAIALGLGVLPLVWNHHRTGSFIGYESLARDSLPTLIHQPFVVIQNLGFVLKSLSLEILCGVDFTPMSTLGHLLVWGGSGILLGLMTLGFTAWMRADSVSKPLRLATGLYLLFHLGLHTFWLARHPHYLWPLLPLVAFFFCRGLDEVPKRLRVSMMSVMALALVATYGSQAVFALRDSRSGSQRHPLPANAYRWIVEHTPPDAHILAAQSAALSLYTHRYSRTVLQVTQEDEFYATLLDSGITHVALQPTAFLHVLTRAPLDPAWQWKQYQSWTSAQSMRFTGVYENKAESTRIIAVLPNLRFQKAYTLYRDARNRLGDKVPTPAQWVEHMEVLQQAMDLEPFPALANAYAVAALLSGNQRTEAVRYLKKALLERPGYSPARYNLARLYTQMGEKVLAEKAYHEAAQMKREITQID